MRRLRRVVSGLTAAAALLGLGVIGGASVSPAVRPGAVVWLPIVGVALLAAGFGLASSREQR